MFPGLAVLAVLPVDARLRRKMLPVLARRMGLTLDLEPELLPLGRLGFTSASRSVTRPCKLPPPLLRFR